MSSPRLRSRRLVATVLLGVLWSTAGAVPAPAAASPPARTGTAASLQVRAGAAASRQAGTGAAASPPVVPGAAAARGGEDVSEPLPAAARTAAGASQSSDGAVLGSDAAGALPGRYIVVLRRDRVVGQGAGAAARALAGAAVNRVYGNVFGFSARLTAQAARRLAAHPAVAAVEQDRVIRLSATQQDPPWGLDRVDERTLPLSHSYLPSSSAAKVHAYVIDTGIRISHRDLGGRATYGYDFVGGDRYAGDCNGHGTHVAGTIGGTRYGVAKKVRLVAVRVLDCRGSGSLSDIIDGIDWVTEHAVKPAVANMSLGGSYSYALDYAVERSIRSGVTYTVAAGNESQDAYYTSPADVPAAITVGATDSRDRRAGFSNYGSSLDLFAPGVGITSAVAKSDTATGSYSGTSMAAPHVAGAAAMVLAAHPTWTPRQVRDLLVQQSTTGRVGGRGTGSPNRLLHTAAPPAAPTIATKTVAVAVVGRAYRIQLALGSSRQGSWSLAGGRLPAGLKLSATGVISGTPTAAGVVRCTVRFTDYVPRSATRGLTVTVKLAPPAIITAVLPAALTGVAYTAQLAVRDGRPGTWSIASGHLPAGLALSTAGLITGVATVEGSSDVTVRFTDKQNAATTRSFTLVVDPAPPVITTASLPDGTVGAAYEVQLDTADHRTGMWAVVEGELPDGLTLQPDGLLTGVPLTAQSATVVVAFGDTMGLVAQRTLAIDIQPAV
jgi:subtilisin family serine protease